MDYTMLAARSRIISATRAFFDGRGYLEVLTPLLAPALIPEACLEVFETTLLPPRGSRTMREKPYYLVPSPEIWMKKLIAAHRASVYQICPSFRNCESTGSMHNPEFLMLEYYTMQADYLDSLALTEALFTHLLAACREDLLHFQTEEALAGLAPPFIRLTMEEAFCRCAGFSLNQAIARGTLGHEARRLGMEIAPETPDADIYNLIFIHRVENALPREKPVALLDYPAIVPCLAQLKPSGGDGSPLCRERWELYLRGIEAANCYSEETDGQAAGAFFQAEAAEKARSAAVPHAVDTGWLQIFQDGSGFPRCSGVAVGMDRLIMALLGTRTLAGVLPFPMTRG
ncbi:MAG: LysR family transcriptional regulator [Spirochaetaceae bacterium]|jgi:lysyl-tRNA synthetase class 2|nr:LysR family transcriptional regulator [Spirochaetaceae bacterium]